MRYPADHKAKTKGRILEAAGKSFRKQGFNLTGVDGLAAGAGVTSGAFYGHFRSKTEAFRAALSAGLEELRQGIEACQAKFGDAWVEELAEFYFTTRVTCDLAEGCALPSLSADVARGDAKTKATFEKEFLSIVATLAKGLPGTNAEQREARAIVMAALFPGGVAVRLASGPRSIATGKTFDVPAGQAGVTFTNESTSEEASCALRARALTAH